MDYNVLAAGKIRKLILLNYKNSVDKTLFKYAGGYRVISKIKSNQNLWS